MVNDKMCSILGDNNEAICWLHVLNSADSSKQFNTYLVGVPKGTSLENVRIEYLNPQPCFFRFQGLDGREMKLKFYKKIVLTFQFSNMIMSNLPIN